MVNIIVAVAENGVIGDKNALLWHISEDLKYFKSVTSGHPVVMGRKTYESLGRPLPNRTNVVVTRQEMEIPGCRVAHSLEEAVALFPAEEEVFVIGGAQIYAQALPLAGRFYLTRVSMPTRAIRIFPHGTTPSGGSCRPSRSLRARIIPIPLRSRPTNGGEIRYLYHCTARP